MTGSPSTTSRRAPSASATVTSAPAAVCAGTPGTMSTQTGSVRSWSRAVAPVAGSTRSARSAVWSRGWTTTSRPWSSQTTSARYSSVQRIGVRRPSKVMIFGADQRVRRARRRVGDDRRVPVGVRGIGDVPALHRGVVDARDDQCVARGRPPVAAHPLHLLGGDEVGEPVAHLGAVRCGEGARRSRLQVVHVQRAAADVGDVPTVRVRPRVDHAAGRVDPPRRGLAREVDDVQPPGVRERRRRSSPGRWRSRRCRPPVRGCAPVERAPRAGGPRRPRCPARRGRRPGVPRRW